jgi:hypothetical protein
MRPPSVHRRRLLQALAAAAAMPIRQGYAAASAPTTLAAAWDDERGRHHVGLLDADAHGIAVTASIEVPTRAHGLACMRDGSVVAVARRPGEWMLRWRPRGGADWRWTQAEQRFNGHVLVTPGDGGVFTTETDLLTGEGFLVRRDPASLAQLEVWPTHGRDPHDLEWLGDGGILVANGGIETLPETGRIKHDLAHMDASLVRIDAASGALTGQWRLTDPRLSIRHLVQHRAGLVGVGLQAEHNDAAARAGAPVFAVFDPARDTLQTLATTAPGSGYGGDVAAMAAGWLVGCPRDNAIMQISLNQAVSLNRLPEGCAVVADRDRHAWALGNSAALELAWPDARDCRTPPLRFDNHALILPRRQG